MDLKISENIKRLRREKNFTQENMADLLGISFQTISKWERGDGYPDITMLPAIANLFYITVDELLGMDVLKRKEEIYEIQIKCGEYERHNQMEEIIKTIREALKKYPNDYELMSDLAYYLGYFVSDVDKLKESVKISEYILDTCTDCKIRNNVQANICYSYWKLGDAEKAVELAKQLPNYYKTSQDALRNFLYGKELVKHVQDEIIINLAYEFWYSIRKIKDEYTLEDQIKLYEKSNAIYQAYYETEDVPFALIRILCNYQDMAGAVLAFGDADRAFGYLEKAAEYAVKHDELPMIVKPTSLLFNQHEYDRKYERDGGQKCCELLKYDLNIEDRYLQYREDSRFKKIIKILDI